MYFNLASLLTGLDLVFDRDCNLTGRIADGDIGVLRVSAVRRREHTGVDARVLRAPGVHQSQRTVSKWDPEAVELHVVVPGRRGGALT